MEDIISIIDKIIEEHKIILADAKKMETAVNDAQSIMALEISKETFIPGRLDHHSDLIKLEEIRIKVEEGLKAHFNREETGLLIAFQKHGEKRLVDALQTLLLEHQEIRSRFDHQRVEIEELIHGKLSRHVWEGRANELRGHIAQTNKLLAAHANYEQEMLFNLRDELDKTKKS